MAKFKLSLLTIIADESNNYAKCLQSMISEFDSEIEKNTLRDGAYTKNTSQKSFCYSYNEQLKIQKNNQKELTFSMNKMTIHNDSWEENPFVQNISVGSQLALVDKYENTILFSVKSINHTFKEQNTTYQYTCQDSFSFQLSRQNAGYTIENDPNSDDFIGSQPVDWWVNNKIVPECYVSYTYLAMNQGLYIGYDNKLHTYYANQRLYNIKKILKQPQTAQDYYEAISFSGSGTANSLLISLGEQLGLSLNTCEAIGDQGILLKYFWFEPSKNEQPSGLYLSPYADIQNFSLQHTGNALTTVLNVSGGEVDGELVTLLPTITPFFNKYFQSQEWQTGDYKPGMFTRLCYGNNENLFKTQHNFINNSVKSYVSQSTADEWNTATGETAEDKKLSLLNSNLKVSGTRKPQVCVMPVFNNPNLSDVSETNINTALCDVYIPLTNTTSKLLTNSTDTFSTYTLSSFYSKYAFSNEEGNSYILVKNNKNENVLLTPQSYSWNLSLIEPQVSKTYFISPFITKSDIQQKVKDGVYYPYASIGINKEGSNIWSSTKELRFKDNTTWKDEDWLEIEIYSYKKEEDVDNVKSQTPENYTNHIQQRWTNKSSSPKIDIASLRDGTTSFEVYISSNRPDAFDFITWGYINLLDEFVESTSNKEGFYRVEDVRDCYLWVSGVDRNFAKPGKHLTPSFLTPRVNGIEELLQNNQGISVPIQAPLLFQNGDKIVNNSEKKCFLLGKKQTYSNKEIQPDLLWEKVDLYANKSTSLSIDNWSSFYLLEEQGNSVELEHSRDNSSLSLGDCIARTSVSINNNIPWQSEGFPYRLITTKQLTGTHILLIYKKNDSSPSNIILLESNKTYNFPYDSISRSHAIKLLTNKEEEAKHEYISFWEDVETEATDAWETISIQKGLPDPYYNSVIQSNSEFILNTEKCSAEDQVYGQIRTINEHYSEKITQISFNNNSTNIRQETGHNFSIMLVSNNESLELTDLFSIKTKFGFSTCNVWPAIVSSLTQYRESSLNVVVSGNSEQRRIFELHSLLLDIPSDQDTGYSLYTKDPTKLQITSLRRRTDGTAQWTSSFYVNKDTININDEGSANPIISCSLIISLLDPQADKEDILEYGSGFNNELLERLYKIPGTNTYTFAVNNTSDLLFGNTWRYYSMQSTENLIHNLYTNNAFTLKENLRILIKSSNSYDYTWVVYNNNYDLIDCGSSQSRRWLTTETQKLDSNYQISTTGEDYQCIDINSILNRTSGQYCSVIFRKTEDDEQSLLGSNCWSHNLFMLDGDQIVPAFCLYGLGREPDVLSGQVCQAYFNSETVIGANEEISLVALNKPQLTYIKVRVPYSTATILTNIQDYSFYLQWSRDATAEDIQFAQIADQCPWLENRLVDFKYFYERNILTKKEFEDITNLFNNTLRILNGRLLAASHLYYSALHNKTKTISNFTNNLDLLGANFSAEILTPYQKGASSFDTTQFKQSYKQLFPTTPYGYPLLDYDNTFSDYVNKYFNAEQRFLKNIYNFKNYFEEPISFYPKGGGLYNNTVELINNKIVSSDKKSFVQISFPSANMMKLTASYNNYIQDPLDSRWGYCFDNFYQKTNSGFQLLTPVDASYINQHKKNIKVLTYYEEGFERCVNEQYNPARKYYRKDWKFAGTIKDQNYLYDNAIELIDESGRSFVPYKTNEGLFYKEKGIITGGDDGTNTTLLEPGHDSYNVTAVYVEVSKSNIEKNYLAKVITDSTVKTSSSLWYWKNTEPYVQILSGTDRWLTPDELSTELPVYFKRKIFSKNPRSDEYTDTITDKLISDVETDFSGSDARDIYIRYFPIQEIYFYDNSISFIDNQPSVLNKAGKTFKEWKELYEKDMASLEEQPYLYKTYQRVGFVNEDNYKQYFWRTYTTSATGPGLEYDLTALKTTTNVSTLKDKESFLQNQSNLLTLANEVYQFEDSAFGNIGSPSTTVNGDSVYYWNKIGYKEGYSGTDDDYNIKKQIFVQNTGAHRLYRVYQTAVLDGLHTGYFKTNSSGNVEEEKTVSNNRIHYYNYAGNILHTYHSINKQAGSTYIQPYSSFHTVKNQYYYNGKWYRPKKLTDLVNRNDNYKILIQPEKYINITNINNETAEANCTIKFSLDQIINAIQFYPLTWVLSKCDFTDLEWGNQQTLTLENALLKAGLAGQQVADDSYKVSLTGGASTSTHVNQFDAYIYHEEDYLAMDILQTYDTTKDNWYQLFLADNHTIYDSSTDLKVDFTSEPRFLEGFYSATGGDSSLKEVDEFNINAEYYELRNGFYEPIYTIEQLKTRENIYYLNNVSLVEETIDAPTEWKQDVNVIYGKMVSQKHLIFTEPEGANRQLKQYDKVTIDFIDDETPKTSTWIIQSMTQSERTYPITYNLIWEEGDSIDKTGLNLTVNGTPIQTTSYELSTSEVMSTEDYTHNTQNVCFNYGHDYITVTYQDQEYQFAYRWEREEIFNFDLMSNGMFWLNFHNSLEYSTLFQQAALIEMKLTEYWSQAYNASQFCQYFLPASWQPTSNNEANVFAGEILKVVNEPSSLRTAVVTQKESGEVERDYSNLSSVTLAATYIPEVEVLNQDNAEYYRYSLKFYSNTSDLIKATISSNAIAEDLQQNCFYSLDSCIQQNAALQDLVNTLKINPGQWLAVQSGKQTYYRRRNGGTTWKQLAYRLLNEQLEYFGGWYQMAVYALSVPFYTPQNVNQYYQLQKEHNDIWKKIYITYPHVLLEKDYKNTTALDSQSLLKTATYAFNDYKDIERQYSITLLDANSIKGYEGQELRIGDSIALKYTDYHNDVGEIQDGLKQLLFITDLSYNLRQDTDIAVTVNTIKYQDKLIQRLAKLIR